MPISETPNQILHIMMNDSAAELVIARRVAFIDSEERTPFLLMMSIDGLM